MLFKGGILLGWYWAWVAISFATVAFSYSFEVKKENKKLKERIERIEEIVYK
jgi:hypothetical protein